MKNWAGYLYDIADAEEQIDGCTGQLEKVEHCLEAQSTLLHNALRAIHCWGVELVSDRELAHSWAQAMLFRIERLEEQLKYADEEYLLLRQQMEADKEADDGHS